MVPIAQGLSTFLSLTHFTFPFYNMYIMALITSMSLYFVSTFVYYPTACRPLSIAQHQVVRSPRSLWLSISVSNRDSWNGCLCTLRYLPRKKSDSLPRDYMILLLRAYWDPECAKLDPSPRLTPSKNTLHFPQNNIRFYHDQYSYRGGQRVWHRRVQHTDPRLGLGDIMQRLENTDHSYLRSLTSTWFHLGTPSPRTKACPISNAALAIVGIGTECGFWIPSSTSSVRALPQITEGMTM